MAKLTWNYKPAFKRAFNINKKNKRVLKKELQQIIFLAMTTLWGKALEVALLELILVMPVESGMSAATLEILAEFAAAGSGSLATRQAVQRAVARGRRPKTLTYVPTNRQTGGLLNKRRKPRTPAEGFRLGAQNTISKIGTPRAPNFRLKFVPATGQHVASMEGMWQWRGKGTNALRRADEKASASFRKGVADLRKGVERWLRTGSYAELLAALGSFDRFADAGDVSKFNFPNRVGG